MNARISILGLCLGLALLAGALSAQGAAAAGTTELTCAKQEGGAFEDAHCTRIVAHGSYEDVAIPVGEETEATTTNEGTASETEAATPGILRWTINGVPIELEAAEVHGEGAIENSEDEGGEMYLHGEGASVFSGVKVVEPEHCKVTQGATEGAIETNPLRVTSQGQGMALKLEPGEGAGGVLAEFNIENSGGTCAAALTGIKIVGSLKAVPAGATSYFSEAETTAAATLRIGNAKGPKAGLELTTTGRGRANPEEPWTALAATTG
jgi:hypothetical protein